MSDLPTSIWINEEGPREGFQFEPGPIPTARKIELIDSLSRTGLKQIQIVSFVSAKNVPGMADSEAVVQGFARNPQVSYTGLWLNERGLQRALSSGRLDVKGALFLSASEAFLLRNQKIRHKEHVSALHSLVKMYQEHEVPVELGGLMAAFGCNFEGDIPISRIIDLVQQLLDIAAEHRIRINTFSLADTMAWATPLSIRRVVGAVRAKFPDLQIALHLHDTRGMGIANACAGLEMGVTIFDAAVGGLGGCPFAGHKGAAGNVCSEDLVFICQEMGIDTGVDLDRLIESALLAEDIVGHPLPGRVMRGGTLKRLRESISVAT